MITVKYYVSEELVNKRFLLIERLISNGFNPVDTYIRFLYSTDFSFGIEIPRGGRIEVSA